MQHDLSQKPTTDSLCQRLAQLVVRFIESTGQYSLHNT